MDFSFGCRMVVFEWEGFSLESLRRMTQIYLVMIVLLLSHNY